MLQAIKRNLAFVALILTGILFVFVVGCVVTNENTVDAQEEFVRPTLVPAEILTPAPKPADDRQVAILNLVVVSSSDGNIERVTLEQGRIINSFAPNVLGLTGPWTVELVGEERVRFGTLDPREIRIYDQNEELPHDVSLGENIAWELVVPLYDNGQDLGVREINIYDQNENLIFNTLIDREAWQETTNPE
jgi:hypothetical protein